MIHRSRFTQPLFVFVLAVALAGPGAAWLGLSDESRAGIPYTSAADIQDAQGILVRLGYLSHGSFTKGVNDNPTTDAISAFQASHSLRSSGEIDFDTMAYLTTHDVPQDAVALAEPPAASTATLGAASNQPAETASPTDPGRERAAAPQPEPAKNQTAVPPASASATSAPEPDPASIESGMPATDAPIGFLAALGALALLAGGALFLGKHA